MRRRPFGRERRPGEHHVLALREEPEPLVDGAAERGGLQQDRVGAGLAEPVDRGLGQRSADALAACLRHHAHGADPAAALERDARGGAHGTAVGIRDEHLAQLAAAQEAELIEDPRAEAGARPHGPYRRKLLIQSDAYRARGRHAMVTVPASPRSGKMPSMVTIAELVIADPPDVWEALGFDVEGDACRVGSVTLRLAGRERGDGIVEWSLAGAPAGAELDGLPTRLVDAAAAPGDLVEHPNGALQLDHL